MDNFDLKKYLGSKTLLNESAPGYDTRKTGESLPTLESVKAAYEAKKEDITETRDLSVKEKMDNILYVMDPVQVIDELLLAMFADDAHSYLDAIIKDHGIMDIDEAKKVEEVSSHEGSRIEGLLNQQLKSKFLNYFEELFYDLVEEEVFPVEDVIDQLSMEMTKRIYGKPLTPTAIDEEDSNKKPLPKPVAKDLKKMKTNFSDLKKRLKLEEEDEM